MPNLLIGVTLAVISVGALIAAIPRRGKTARFVGTPIIEEAAAILLIGAFAFGLVLIVGHFTTIDDISLSGAMR